MNGQRAQLSAQAVANHFLSLAEVDGKPVCHMKLQKLLYFSYGFWLAMTNGERLFRQGLNAWPYGPVVVDVYEALKSAGSRTIESYVVDRRTGETPTIPNTPEYSEIRDFLSAMWKAYKDLPAIRLSEISHDPDGPWAGCWKTKTPWRNSVAMDDDAVREYFADLLADDGAAG